MWASWALSCTTPSLSLSSNIGQCHSCVLFHLEVWGGGGVRKGAVLTPAFVHSSESCGAHGLGLVGPEVGAWETVFPRGWIRSDGSPGLPSLEQGPLKPHLGAPANSDRLVEGEIRETGDGLFSIYCPQVPLHPALKRLARASTWQQYGSLLRSLSGTGSWCFGACGQALMLCKATKVLNILLFSLKLDLLSYLHTAIHILSEWKVMTS